MAPAYHLPQTDTGRVRIGKDSDATETGAPESLKQDDPSVEAGDTQPNDSDNALMREPHPTKIDENHTTETQTEDKKPEPKTNVLALGTPALGNPII